MATKRKKCEKTHVAELPTFPFEAVQIRYHKSNGDTFINGYSIVKMLASIGMHKQATALASRLADIVQKD